MKSDPKPPQTNHPLILNKQYHIWREGKYLGIAEYQNDRFNGECFIMMGEFKGKPAKYVCQPDKWELSTE